MTLNILWSYYCNTTISNNHKIYNIMILSRRVTDDGYEVIMEAVGCAKDDIAIQTRKDGTLNVTMKENAIYKERNRTFMYDTNVLDASKTKAKLEHGVLTLNVPFTEKQRSVKIDVE